MFLFKDTLFNVYYWFIDIDLTLKSTMTHNSYLNKAYLTHIFSIRHFTAFIHLETLHFSTMGAILNNEITNKKYGNAKNMALHRPKGGHLFIVWELEQEDREHHLVWPPTRNVCFGWLKICVILCISVNDHKER